jgi:hypothetical protein
MKTFDSRTWTGAVLVLLAALSAVRCARTDRAALGTDPSHTIQTQFASTNGLDSVLDRSCGDCHSNTMSPDWSKRAAPVRWMMSRAATDGRKAVNFAEWSSYSPEQRRAFLVASCADAKAGKMPIGSYLRFRAEAQLSPRDIETICSASTAAVASGQR